CVRVATGALTGGGAAGGFAPGVSDRAVGEAIAEAIAGPAAIGLVASLGLCPHAHALKASAQPKSHWVPIRCMLFLCRRGYSYKAQDVP
ncbi:MAG: hypothetical protein K2Q97_02670, partial [Burkholderiaceae bacterium]|nr:hypothetical protein [Burkholderiaceae bacterium]